MWLGRRRHRPVLKRAAFRMADERRKFGVTFSVGSRLPGPFPRSTLNGPAKSPGSSIILTGGPSGYFDSSRGRTTLSARTHSRELVRIVRGVVLLSLSLLLAPFLLFLGILLLCDNDESWKAPQAIGNAWFIGSAAYMVIASPLAFAVRYRFFRSYWAREGRHPAKLSDRDVGRLVHFRNRRNCKPDWVLWRAIRSRPVFCPQLRRFCFSFRSGRM